MKKQLNLLTCFALLSISGSVCGKKIPEGYWRGAVTRDGAVQLLELNVYYENDSLKGTYNLPDLGLYDEPIKFISQSDTGFSIKIFMGIFNCIINSKHSGITGENKNWQPVGLKLHVKRMTPSPETNHKEEVDIQVKNCLLKGTLFKPSGNGKFPLVIVAHGAQDPTRKNWVYRYYAYFLSQYGYAVYLFDQRGSGESTGDSNASLMEHAEDIISIGTFFSNYKNINGKRLAVIGMSRGGWVASIAAAKTNLFKTTVLIAGPAKGPVALEYDAVISTLKEQEFEQSQIDSAIHFTELYFKTVKDSGYWTALSKMYRDIKSEPWAQELQKPEKLNDDDMRWWQQNDFEPKDYLTKVHSSVLSVFGSSDVLVPASTNVPLMQEYLKSSEKKFSIVTIEDLPHGLYHYQTLHGNIFNWPHNFWVWPKRSTNMDEVILLWLKKNLMN